MQLVGFLMRLGPILFGLGFLAPVLAALLGRLGWAAPFGLSALGFGLIVGGALGGLAMVRSRWI